MNDSETEVLKKAIDYYGIAMQLTVAIEEMAELQKELTKAIRSIPCTQNIAEEIADVEIMIAQLKLIFGLQFQVEEWREKKIERLQRRMG